MIPDEEDAAYEYQARLEEDDSGSVLSTFVAIAASVALHATYFTVTAPLWVPFYVAGKVKKLVKPEPKPIYRGTVRPLGGPI